MFYTQYDNVLTQYLQKGETFVHRKVITETEMHEPPPPKKKIKEVSCESVGVLNLRALCGNRIRSDELERMGALPAFPDLTLLQVG